MHLESNPVQYDSAIVALSVIDADLAAFRRWRYALNIEGHAREIGAVLAETLILEIDDDVQRRLREALQCTGAEVVIAPSVRHLRGCEQGITESVELHVIGRSRVYPRGHKWT